MNNSILRLYYSSPYFIKCLFASGKGYMLNKLRYSKETARLIEEAEKREFWSKDEWRLYHDVELEKIFNLLKNVPYYKNKNYSLSDFKNIPILSKETVRDNNIDLIRDNIDNKKLFCDQTSGTTGTPISIWLDEKSIKFWYALVERRWRNWYDVCNKDKWVIFGGQVVSSPLQKMPPFWVENISMHQLYCSVYHLSSKTVKFYVEKLNKFNPKYIYGYASSLYNLAFESLEQGLVLPIVKVVLSNGEQLYDYQREIISKAFNAPCQDTYGLSETLVAGSECEYNKIHIWPETGIFELLNENGEAVDQNEKGKLVSTGLINNAMPLIKYDTGDCISIDYNYICKCKRSMPIISSIEGRSDDFILTSQGNKIGSATISLIFKSDLNIKESQIVQKKDKSIIVRIVPATKYTNDDKVKIKNYIYDRLGDLNIYFELVDEIKKEKSGKIRSVISEIN